MDLPRDKQVGYQRSVDHFLGHMSDGINDDGVIMESGGGGLVGTSRDYMRLVKVLADGGQVGGVRILQAKTVSMMMRNHLPGNATIHQYIHKRSAYHFKEDGCGFGLGFACFTDPSKTIYAISPGGCCWGGW